MTTLLNRTRRNMSLWAWGAALQLAIGLARKLDTQTNPATPA